MALIECLYKILLYSIIIEIIDEHWLKNVKSSKNLLCGWIEKKNLQEKWKTPTQISFLHQFLPFSPYILFCHTFFIYLFICLIFPLNALNDNFFHHFIKRSTWKLYQQIIFFSLIGSFSALESIWLSKYIWAWHTILMLGNWVRSKWETLKLNAIANIKLHWNVENHWTVYRFCFQ